MVLEIILSNHGNIEDGEILNLYRLNQWSSADKPTELIQALKHSHSLVTARAEGQLVGLGNAISDGYLVVYYPHLLVHPDLHGQGIGRRIVQKLQEKYAGFHQQILVADGESVEFYQKCGFERAGSCQPMWIYQGHDHE